jgi:hypothetical protein
MMDANYLMSVSLKIETMKDNCAPFTARLYAMKMRRSAQDKETRRDVWSPTNALREQSKPQGVIRVVCALVGAHLFASMARSNVQARLTLVMAAQQKKFVFPLPEILTGNFVQNRHYQIPMAVRFFVMKYTEKFYAQQKCLPPGARRKLRVL